MRQNQHDFRSSGSAQLSSNIANNSPHGDTAPIDLHIDTHNQLTSASFKNPLASFQEMAAIGNFNVDTAAHTMRTFFATHDIADSDIKLEQAQAMSVIIKQRCAELESATAGLEKIRKTTSGIIKAIERITTSNDRLGEQIEAGHKLFRKNFFGDKLKERECDKLVEKVLGFYGHRNSGEYLSARRNPELSTWKPEHVPPAVKALVKYRGCSKDANLDAHQVLPHLRKALHAMSDQLRIEEKRKAIKPILLETSSLQAKAGLLVDLWHNEPNRPKSIDKLSTILLQPFFETEEHKANVKVLKGYRTLDKALDIVSNELLTNLALQLGRQRFEGICNNPTATFQTMSYKNAAKLTRTLFFEAPEELRSLCISNLERDIKSLGWGSPRLKHHLKGLLREFKGLQIS